MVTIAKAAASTGKAETAGGGSQDNPRAADGDDRNKQRQEKETRPTQAAKGEGASGSFWDHDLGGSNSGNRDERREQKPPNAGKPRSTEKDHAPTGNSHGRQKKLPRWRMHFEFIRQLFAALFNIALNALAHYGSQATAVLPDVLPWVAGESPSYCGASRPCMSSQAQLH